MLKSRSFYTQNTEFQGVTWPGHVIIRFQSLKYQKMWDQISRNWAMTADFDLKI